jgi:hypothetical protein
MVLPIFHWAFGEILTVDMGWDLLEVDFTLSKHLLLLRIWNSGAKPFDLRHVCGCVQALVSSLAWRVLRGLERMALLSHIALHHEDTIAATRGLRYELAGLV